MKNNLLAARRTFVLSPGRNAAMGILAGLVLLGCGIEARAATYVFQVPSTAAWTDTGLDIFAGTELAITATGVVQYGPMGVQVTGPDGGNWDGQKFLPQAVLSNTVVVSLIGKIGGTTDIGTGTPVPEGVLGNGIGFVGSSYDQIIPTTGRLFLGFNDLVGSWGDNSGSFTVSVSVIPEPSSLAIVGLGILALVCRPRLFRTIE